MCSTSMFAPAFFNPARICRMQPGFVVTTIWAPVFKMFGFDPALNTPIFAASRVAGWCAHVVEQHDHNRLIRPRSLFKMFSIFRHCNRSAISGSVRL